MSDSSWYSVKHRVFHLSGFIDNTHVAMLHKFLLLVFANKALLSDPVSIVINSEGGSDTDGFALYDLLRNFANNQLILEAHGLGQVQSSAIFPLLACDKRYCTTHTAFSFHHGTATITDEPQREVLEIAKEIIRADDAYMHMIADRTDMTLNQVKKLVDKSSYFDAEEAFALGIIHKIIRGR